MKAAEFYQRAFGAEVATAMPSDGQGRTMHVHLYINGGSVMLSDPYPEHGHHARRPEAFSILLQVDDIAAWWEQATSAGAEVVMPVEDMFWGGRYGQIRDPFGVVWAMNQYTR